MAYKDVPAPKQAASSRPVTCKDVAALAGVSVASVCRVFDKKWEGRVSEKLKNRVLSAAAELKYHPNAFARGLISKNSGIIGIVMSDEFNVFYFDLFQRITNLIQSRGMRVMVFNAAPYRDLTEVFNSFTEYQVDGVIITAAARASSSAPLSDRLDFPGPVILLNLFSSNEQSVSVICDNRKGTMEMARYLYACGGRDFLYISADKSQYYDVAERLEGFQAGLKECGPHRLRVEYGDYSYESGRKIAASVLTQDPPDTVFSTGTRMAFGFMDYARYTAGLSIPEDLNIAAYDDLYGVQFESYDLTCIEQPSQALAERAVQLMMDALEGIPLHGLIYRESPFLRMRGSVRRKTVSP